VIIFATIENIFRNMYEETLIKLIFLILNDNFLMICNFYMFDYFM